MALCISYFSRRRKNCEYVSIISNLTALLHQSGPHLLQAFVSFHLYHERGLLSILTENNSSQEVNVRLSSQFRHSSTVFKEIEHIA